MTNLHFCENCNKLRLTCEGKLRPASAATWSSTSANRSAPERRDDELRALFLDVVARKPQAARFPRQLPAEPQDGRDRRLSGVQASDARQA